VLGLSAGNSVTLRGVEIGRIARTEFQPGAGRPRVILRIDNEWQIHENAVAQIVQPNLFGQRTVDIMHPATGPSGRALVQGDQIETRSTVDLTQALSEIGDSIGGTAGDIRELAQSLNQNQEEALTAFTSLIEDNRPRVDSILTEMDEAAPALREAAEGVRDVTRSIREGDGLAARMVNDPALAEDVSVAATNLSDITTRVSDADGTLWRLLEDDTIHVQIEEIVEDLRSAAQGLRDLVGAEDGALASLAEFAEGAREVLPDLQATMENAREVSRKVNEGVGTIGMMINDPALYNDLRAALQRVNETFEEAEEGGVIRTFLSVFFGAFM
jgi:phospholipid/cholesterol/gamma-HCH transport system substrate-binding protein